MARLGSKKAAIHNPEVDKSSDQDDDDNDDIIPEILNSDDREDSTDDDDNLSDLYPGTCLLQIVG